MNYVRSKFINQRIDKILTEDNFFFFKIFQDHEADYKLKNEIEKREIERLIKAHYSFNKVYIKQGQIEPMYLTEEERKLLTEGMEQSIEKINLEISKSIKLTKQITGKIRPQLIKNMQKIEEIQKTFGNYLSQRSFVFQKFSFHSLILAREIFSKTRE